MIETKLQIRPRTLDDDEDMLRIWLQHEDVFQFSLEAWRYHMDERAREPGMEPVVMAGRADGRVVGYWYGEPDRSSVGVYYVEVEVDDAEQGHGYGSALWNEADSYLTAKAVGKAYGSIHEDWERGKQFATERGFVKTGRAERISRLKLSEANLEGYDGVEQRLTDEGISIRTAAELDLNDDDFMHELHVATSSMIRDIPRTEEWKPDSYEIWRENFLKWPGSNPETYWIALRDSHPIGVADLQKNGDNLMNGLTGVVPAERHKGVARALKCKTIQWGRENGSDHIDTANDFANEAMLSINIPLGYHPLPAREEWLKEYPAAAETKS